MISAGLAPIALFAYNRPEHLRQVSDALARNPQAHRSRLFVFSDAPKGSASEERVAQVRMVARQLSGFGQVEIVEQPENRGIARSIIDGVTYLTAEFGRVIVLEDDLLPSLTFLRFMNEALELYKDDDPVASVHAYAYPVPEQLPETFFLRGADCWGWGTWKRAWRHFESDGVQLLKEIEARGLTRTFDFDGSYPYTRMLRDQIAGKNDSWAIRWHASAFLQNRLTLFPNSSQIQNLGADGSGIHVGRTSAFEHRAWGRPIALRRIPLQESRDARIAFARFLKALQPSLLARIHRRVTRRRRALADISQ